MSDDIRALLAKNVTSILLKVLVFGPQVHSPSSDPRTAKLQAKRIQIRQELEKAGHHVKYAEDIVDPTVGGAGGNVFFQELLIMREYDFIVIVVDSPGSITEMAAISVDPALARKSSLFLDEAYLNGLVAAACSQAEDIGAHFRTYAYPKDLDDCHLLTEIEGRVAKIQKLKYLI